MQKQVVEGTLIRDNGDTFVMEEANGARMTYSRSFYRLPMDYGDTGEPRAVVLTNKLPIDLAYSFDGAILVPA